MYRLLALDLDGTLLTPAGQLTQETKSAIAQARAAGMKVVIATGRSGQEAAWFSTQAGCDSLAAALGGAALVDTQTGEHLRRWDLPEESGRTALALCLASGVELMIFAGTEIVLDPASKQSLLHSFPTPIFHETAAVTPDPAAYLQTQGLPLTKLHGDGDPARFPLAQLGALPGVQLTRSNDHDFELIPAGADKGRAIALIAMMYGIPLSETAAVGDSENDRAMLAAVGLPIAMGNADPALRAIARYVTDTNGQEGVARAIQYCLRQNKGELV